ncbi:MAG TPA: hypothetical protein VFK80_11755, partial [Limnochordia bacterium]|nr:hypothetical protein [Limnochordia bacterium]
VAFTLAGGAVGSLHAGYVLPAGYDTCIGLRGSLGFINWQPQNHHLRVHSEHPDWRGQPTREIRFEPERVKGYGADGEAALLDLAAAIRDPARRPLRSDIQNGVAVLRLLEAAYAAAR